jgi:hypothetical protein
MRMGSSLLWCLINEGTNDVTAMMALKINTAFSIRSSCRNAQLLKADIDTMIGTTIQWIAHNVEVHMPVLSKTYCLDIILFFRDDLEKFDLEKFDVNIYFYCPAMHEYKASNSVTFLEQETEVEQLRIIAE